MRFGEALRECESGKKIARKGWNGKGMYVIYTCGRELVLVRDDIWTKAVREIAKENGGSVKIRPYLSLKTAQGDLQIGWLASQSDMLAEDWEVVE